MLLESILDKLFIVPFLYDLQLDLLRLLHGLSLLERLAYSEPAGH